MQIALRKGTCNFTRVFVDYWSGAEKATGVRECGTGCTLGTGTGSGVCTGVNVNVF